MFSQSCKYAIRAVFFLSVHTDDSKKIGVERVADELDIPKHFLAKILQQLTRHQIISSSKGRHGGFYLSDENQALNLYQVILAFDGPSSLTDCVLGLKDCSNSHPCPFHDSIQAYRDQFLTTLQNETIRESALRISSDNLKLRTD